MNTERVIEGPGSLDTATYIWQVALILSVAFILGYLLRYLLNDSLKRRIVQLEEENSNLSLVEKDSANAIDEIEKFKIMIGDQKAEIERLNTKLSDCFAARIKAENQLSAVQIKYDNLVSTQEKVVGADGATTENIAVEGSELADSKIVHYTVSSTKDDLKKIEGIGPKIEQLLNADGINTFQDIINTSVERIRGILTAAGPNYAVHDPATWAEQSELADAGKWEALDALQEELKGGKRK